MIKRIINQTYHHFVELLNVSPSKQRTGSNKKFSFSETSNYENYTKIFHFLKLLLKYSKIYHYNLDKLVV